MMILILILALLLGQVDHHAAEYDPFHDHLAVSRANVSAAVSPDGHVHSYTTPHRHGAASTTVATEAPATGQVTIVQARTVSPVAMGGAVPIASVVVNLMPPAVIAYAIRPAVSHHASVIPLTLEPPPRLV